MFLEIVLLLLLLFAALVIVYKGAVHEYQILQKEWSPNIEWSHLLKEQLPIVIRNVSPEWRGNWTRKATEHKSWPVYVETEEEIQRTSWKDWIHSSPGEPHITNNDEIASIAKLPLQEWFDGGFSRWCWLPKASPNVFVLTSESPLPLTKTTAAATLLQATDGEPITVWLAHDGSVPSEIQADIKGKDPWKLTATEVPLFDEVKFIEVKVRPGNALVIPTHWWFSVTSSSVPTKADGGWGWIATFQTPVSWIVSSLTKS